MIRPHFSCKILILAVVLSINFLNLGAANRYSVATGNWNSTSTWSATSGGPPGASVPGKNDDVYIENGHTITVSDDQSCSSITFTGITATLVINSPAILSVKNGVTLNKQTGSDSECFVIGTGTLTCTEVTVGTEDNPPPADPSFSSVYNHTFNSSIANLNLTVKGSPRNNITINSYVGGTTNFRNGVFNILSGTVNVDGKIITSNDSSLNVSTLSMAAGSQTGTLVLNGSALPFDLSSTGTSNMDFNGSSSTVNYARGGTQTVLGTNYHNLTLSGSGAKTFNNNVSVYGTLSREGFTTCAGTTPTYGPLSAIKYKGSGAQTTGIEFPALFDGQGGIIIENVSGVTLNSSRTVTYKLTFINGRLATGSNTLTLSSSGEVIGAGPGKYVNGNLCKGISTGTVTKTFEIGDATVYAPVSLEFFGTITTEGQITAKTTYGDHPNIGSSTFNIGVTVNRYWTITNSNVSGFISYKTTLNFSGSDVDPGADYNNFYIGQYRQSEWYYPALGSLGPTSSQATGLNTFGDFQIGERPIASYRTRQSGDWNMVSTWESFDGTNWIPALTSPTSASGYITIRASHTVNNTALVTVDQVIIDPGGYLNLYADLVLNDGSSYDFSLNGTLNCVNGNITGTGSFLHNEFADLIITSPDGITLSGATGNIRSGTRIFSAWGNYNYSGTSAQVTGNGLPSSVNNFTINNILGVSLTNSLTINGILNLSSGQLIINSGTLTLQHSDTPVIRTSGTILTSKTSSFSFGSSADSTGADFTLPEGVFTEPAEINNLTLYRINPLTLNDQNLFVYGIVLNHGPLNTNDRLVLASDATGTGLIAGEGRGTITGNVTMQRYLPEGFGYKYLSSPFLSATINEISDEADLSDPFPVVWRYDESSATTGWISYINPSGIMNPLEGYAVNFGSITDPVTTDITGIVNNGSMSLTLYNHNNTYTQGFNLVGNPYPSPINWDNATGWTKTNIDNALYFFKASSTDQYGGTYSTYINGLSSDGIAGPIIPSMQGFFVHVSDGAYPVTGTLGLDNSVRITDQTHPFIKKKGDSPLPGLLRISALFDDETKYSDPAVIYTDPKATMNFDGQLDGLKLMNTDYDTPSLFSVANDGKKLSINSIPPLFGDSCKIPLGLSLFKEGYIIFRITDIGEEMAGMDLNLTDKISGTSVKLDSGNDYRVFLNEGAHNNRFFLEINPSSTGITPPHENDNLIKIYSYQGILFADINILPGKKGNLSIINLAGQILFRTNIDYPGHYEFSHGFKDGIYLVRFTTEMEIVTKRIYIQNR